MCVGITSLFYYVCFGPLPPFGGVSYFLTRPERSGHNSFFMAYRNRRGRRRVGRRFTMPRGGIRL